MALAIEQPDLAALPPVPKNPLPYLNLNPWTDLSGVVRR